MLIIKYALLAAGLIGLAWSAALVVLDLRHRDEQRRRLAQAPAADLALEGIRPEPLVPIRWHRARREAAVSALCLLYGLAIVVVPSGRAGIRVSQLWGTRPGALYPGVHVVKPLVEDVVLYDTRDHLWPASGGHDRGSVAASVGQTAPEPLSVQSKEGLAVGLAVGVRYRLDPQRLAHIHSDLPDDVDTDLVPVVVASAFREVVPNYMVREIFATRREEVRQRAAEIIAGKLGEDGIVVKDVMLRDVVLPAEYAKGLEALLARQQQSERMVFDVEIKQKEVRTAELEAEADRIRQVKAAEALGQVRVLQAKAEADAMQHTLPLKEKQIQQSRLEAEARKEATIKNAEAAAEAKVIDSKAEVQKLTLIAGADAHRVRVMGQAETERMKLESDLLKENPLLIQKIVAERLSDKMQIMMVPMDGRNFFANDVFRSALATPSLQTDDAGAAPARTAAHRK
jgi:regulator of protease activity HflC (stomatin/prohibitin superfamily)